MRRDNERGVALLIVLLLLASLSVIAVSMTQTMRLSTARTGMAESIDQARWYARGAEALATQLITQQWAANPANDSRGEDWLTAARQFPIDGGMIEARLSDETLCFNVNSLVIADEGAREANPEAQERFMMLLDELGLDSVAQETVTETLTDWIDTAGLGGGSGAEDPAYARLDVPYRTAEAPMADISELRAVMWMSPLLYKTLAPHVCVQPGERPSPININLAGPDDRPVLYAAFAGQLSRNEIESLLGAIPAEGFETPAQFWALPVFADKDLGDPVKERFAFYSRFLRLEANVMYDRATFVQESLLEVDPSGGVTTLARRVGQYD